MTHSDPSRARSLPRSRIEFRFFSSASGAPRARRPTDALLLVLSVLIVVVTTASGAGSQLSEATAAFVRALPGLLGWFWELCDTLIAVWAVTLIAAVVAAKGRLSLLRDQTIALAVAIASGILLLDQGASFWSALFASGTGPIFPATRLAVSVAVLATSSPHLGRPVRRVGRWLVLLGSLSAIALGVATPLGVAAGLAIGAGAGAVVHLRFGSPGGMPTPDQVRDALIEMGLDVTGMSAAELGRHGVAVLQATDAHGHDLLVKVYGRDAWGGQLVGVVWSYLWYRDDRSELTLSRLQLVEHEAFLTLMAERGGAWVLPVRAAGMAETDAVIVINAEGPTLAELRGRRYSLGWHTEGTYLWDANAGEGAPAIETYPGTPQGWDAALARFRQLEKPHWIRPKTTGRIGLLYALGPLTGRTLSEICQALGQPRSYSAMAGDQRLIQWQQVQAYGESFHYAMVFDGDVCVALRHEFTR